MPTTPTQPSRRQFIESLAAGSVMAIASSAALAAPSSGEKTPPNDPLTPPLPVPSAAGQQSMLKVATSHTSGIVLGGFGSGSVEIRPDGTLTDWQIYNLGPLSPVPQGQRGAGPDTSHWAMNFILRVQQGENLAQIRRLSCRPDMNDLYNLSWVQNVETIEYDGQYPIANLKYIDHSLPVEVKSAFFSPIIPHDSRTSGTPGFYATFTIKNTSQSPVTVSLFNTIRNPLATGEDDRKLDTQVKKEGDTTFLHLTTKSEATRKMTIGSMSVGVTGGEASYIKGDFRGFLSNGEWAGKTSYGRVHETYLKLLREHAKLPNLDGMENPFQWITLTDAAIDRKSLDEKKKLLAELTTYPAFWFLAKRVERIEPGSLEQDGTLGRFIKECRNRIEAYCGQDKKPQEFGDAVLASTITLAPGAEQQIRFVVGWFFPNHFASDGAVMGHQYEHWFHDASEVATYLAKNAKDHEAKVKLFTDSIYNTTLGQEMAFSWTAQLTTMVKSSWWTKNGLFAIWEGLGCCGLHTTDITYQGSWPIIAMWPELQQQQMLLGAKFQRKDGRVHHFFHNSLNEVDGGFDRVDMNHQFVMLVVRDYLWTGDKDYAQKLWPNVVRAIEAMQTLDTDNDGLIDTDTRRNTYDQWDLQGIPSYISSLWLGGLRAGIRIARDLNENDKADQWQTILDKGRESFEKKLWNGQYYSLWVDANTRDECCMSDQLSGEWFGHLMGVSVGVPRERIVQSLKSIYKHNYSYEHGLLNASYPADKAAHFKTFDNGQAGGNWTGIEYAIASMMIDFGLVDEGYNIVRSVHDRYIRAGRAWNHVECGDHYYRAMSSWALLLALTGFKVDLPRQALTIAPTVKQDELRAPWALPGAWGTLSQKGRELTVNCISGGFSFKQLTLNLPGDTVTITLNGKKLAATVQKDGPAMIVSLNELVKLEEGQTLKAVS